MPDVTLTPVGGDPWNGGAVDLHPSVAPPVRATVPETPVDQNAMYGDPTAYPTAPDQGAALKANASAVGQAVAAVPVGMARGAYDALTYPRDVMRGRVDPTSDEGIGRTLGMAGLMAGPGLGMAEEGAVGAMGGRALTGRNDAQQLTAIQKAMDALIRPGRPTAPSAPASIHDQMAALLRGEAVDSVPLEAVETEMHPRALPPDQLAQKVPDGHFQAFHGSSALFDRFSMDHLGTGEGAQAYGHGMYFAGDQNVGAFYADAYGQPHARPDGSTVNGHMYQVAIPGHPDQFFNQDLSLAEQSPAVRAAVAPLYEQHGLSPDYRGGNLLHEMKQSALQNGVRYRDVDAHVSQQFADRGIPGHSYGGGGDVPNYVVFDPSGVQVMKTYAGGLPLPGSGSPQTPALPTFAQPGTPQPMFSPAPQPAPTSTIPPEMFGRLLREGKAT